MNPVTATTYDVGRGQQGEALEPKASRLRLAVPVLPRLNDLRGLRDAGRDDADRILQGNLGDGTTKERANEVEGGLLKPLLTFEPSSAADREMSARRMCNHQIPIVAEKRRDITYDVLPRTLRGEEVTRPRIVTASRECVTDRARKLTRDEDFHASKPNASAVVFQPDKHASCYELGGLRPKRLVALLQDLEQELLLRQVHDGEVWV